MQMPNENKIQVLKVLEIFKKYSDCDNKINASQIIELLEKEEISAKRRSIYNDITALIHCGYDINKAIAARDGFYYDCRELELPEIRLLIDAISSAPFITQKKTAELIDKLLSLLSIYQAQRLRDNIYCGKRTKFTNEEIYYNIDRINEALTQGKKITFVYYHKIIKNGILMNDDGRVFKVSPYGIFWSDDKYYIAANYDKYDNISHFRIDRMRRVEITDDDIRPLKEVCKTECGFNCGDHVRRSINAFSGEEDDVVMEIPIDMLDIITDKFGEDLKIVSTGDKKICFSIRLNISDGLTNWLLPYCDRLKVLKPEKLVKSLTDRIDSIHKSINTDKIQN